MYDRDYQAVVTHDVILELFGAAYALDEELAGLFGLLADPARAVVYLADVQLPPHLLTNVCAEGAKQRLPKDVLLRALVGLPVKFHGAGPLSDP